MNPGPLIILIPSVFGFIGTLVFLELFGEKIRAWKIRRWNRRDAKRFQAVLDSMHLANEAKEKAYIESRKSPRKLIQL